MNQSVEEGGWGNKVRVCRSAAAMSSQLHGFSELQQKKREKSRVTLVRRLRTAYCVPWQSIPIVSKPASQHASTEMMMIATSYTRHARHIEHTKHTKYNKKKHRESGNRDVWMNHQPTVNNPNIEHQLPDGVLPSKFPFKISTNTAPPSDIYRPAFHSASLSPPGTNSRYVCTTILRTYKKPKKS